ncbi:hypothetical protein DPMN_015991 [Dreissena polymorpha]|uniref:G-protein coupled receptors family 1 profile domain-containing protein n=2 Tax=Dreissena polymorpha TaxID=45954 RepID=A0A9D4NCK4_DREPO|nr:hypothetical protein DPMN_015991 [Dreissena polymorpha]
MLVQSSDIDFVMKRLITAQVLANIGLTVRSIFWLAKSFPSINDPNVTDYKQVACIITTLWTQYFFLCVIFWHLMYGIECFLTSKGIASSYFTKIVIGWMLPASLCTVIAFIAYQPTLQRCSAQYHFVRSAMFGIFLLPIVIVILIVIVLFYQTLKSVKRKLIQHFGRFSPPEREMLDNLQAKYIIIAVTFVICWIPNILNGIFMSILDSVVDTEAEYLILVLLVLEAVLNPFQVVIDAMVMFSWPPVGCCGIFRSDGYRSRGNINAMSKSTVEGTSGETDALLSFSRRGRTSSI